MKTSTTYLATCDHQTYTFRTARRLRAWLWHHKPKSASVWRYRRGRGPYTEGQIVYRNGATIDNAESPISRGWHTINKIGGPKLMPEHFTIGN